MKRLPAHSNMDPRGSADAESGEERRALLDRIDLAHRPRLDQPLARLDRIAARLAADSTERERFLAHPEGYLRRHGIAAPGARLCALEVPQRTSEACSANAACNANTVLNVNATININAFTKVNAVTGANAAAVANVTVFLNLVAATRSWVYSRTRVFGVKLQSDDLFSDGYGLGDPYGML